MKRPTFPRATIDGAAARQPNAASSSGKRFTFVDSLRGLAAFSVLLFHLIPWEAKPGDAAGGGTLARLVSPVAQYGAEGVTVFFVISGFVIAYSLQGARISPGYFGNFVLRRSVRLDPPYWVTIALVIALKALSGRFFPSLGWETPSVPQVLAHLFYLQNILGYGDICSVFWTLCLEVQFYLLFVVFLAANQVLFGQWSGKPLQPRIGSWLIFLPLGIASLVYFQHSFSGIDRHTWFLAHFHKFLLGAFAAWAISSRDLRPLFWCFLACFAAEVVFHSFDLATAIAAFTALGIYFGACFPQIAARADSGLSRYFGRISYSLYLLHVPVGFSIWSIGRRLAGHSSAWRDAWIVISILASIAAAHLMYCAVESTSVKLSQRFKRTKNITPAIDRNSGLTPS